MKKITEEAKQAGIKQALAQAKKDKWPFRTTCKCGSNEVALFAGDGMYDYIIMCFDCGKEIEGNNLKHTLENWGRWLNKKEKEAACCEIIR